MAQIVLVDSGPLVALLDKREQWHDWTTVQMRMVQAPLLTSEAVITEVCFLLRGLPIARQRLRQWAELGMIKLLPFAGHTFASTLSLMLKYENVPMSFADASLVMHAEYHRQAGIFTLDSDFSIYRRADGSPLALIAPFAV